MRRDQRDQIVAELNGRGNEDVVAFSIQLIEVEDYTVAEAVAEALIHYGFEEVVSL
jgi:HEAT repeat protein